MVPEPLEFPTACVSSVLKSSVNAEMQQYSALRLFVNIVDYPEMGHTLFDFLEQYCDVLTLPGEPLGVTDSAVHHKLKSNIKPIYIPAYHLPHRDRLWTNRFMTCWIMERLKIHTLHGIHHYFWFPKG